MKAKVYRPRLIAPKWRTITNPDNSLEVVAWEYTDTPKLSLSHKLRDLKKNWKPPFPKPVTRPR